MKLKFTLFSLFILCVGYSQVTNEGKPLSWDYNLAEVDPITMPEFDLQSLLEEDRKFAGVKDRPWRFGHEFVLYNDLTNSGVWTTLENGDRIWRIRYQSEGAQTLNFLFNGFKMPKGGKVYLYNSDRSDLLGAYDEQQNSEVGILGTWLVTGDDIYIEYFEPAEVAGEGSLEIVKVIHGYRTMQSMNKNVDSNLNGSGNCNMDVDCSITAINSLKDINKRAVAVMIVGGNSFCSGALINNTANDGTPYFLTANHCIENPWTGEPDNPATWAFRFNWISPNPVCATNANSTNNIGSYYQTASGAVLKARRANSDFCLVEITANMPASWNLTWAGWSRSTTPPPSVFGIHHPSGDIMKVCRDNSAPFIDNSNGNVWIVDDWAQGVTEGGSSGSPLFDNNGRIIGQLWRGDAACSGTVDNGGSDDYGRFDVSWSAGSNSTQRLREHLDPEFLNLQSLSYLTSDMLSAENNFVQNKLEVYPNPSTGLYTIAGSTSEVTYTVYNVLGQQVKAGVVNAGSGVLDLSASADGIYILSIIDNGTGAQSTFKLVKE